MVRRIGGRAISAGALAVSLGAASLVVPGVAAAEALPGCSQVGLTVTCSYFYSTGEQVFTVPVGVTSIQVHAVGAQAQPGGPGQAAEVSGVLTGLTPGPLYVLVGGDGFDGRGFNGGGAPSLTGRRYGGGASDVRTKGLTNGMATRESLQSRLIVAGGSAVDYGGGGSAGTPGGDGNLPDGSTASGSGGGPGTSTSGGAGGAGAAGADDGGDGILGGGGAGGNPYGGGGGGGYYGGGGGGGGVGTHSAGGGGGSSLVPAGGSATLASASAAASVTITYTAVTLRITTYSGNRQSARVGQPFPAPLVAKVTNDATSQPVQGAEVTFAVFPGAATATFPGGATTAIVTTGPDGLATSPALTAGPTPGSAYVTASLPDGTAVTFTETITPQPAPPAPTVDAAATGFRGTAGSSVSTGPLRTNGTNELLLAYVAADGPAAAAGQKVTAVTGGGLTWQLAARSNATYGTAEIWQAYATTTFSGSVTASYRSGYDAAIAVVAYKGAANKVGAIGVGSGVSGTAAATVKTTKSNSLVWAAGHNWSFSTSPVPAQGQSLVYSKSDTRVNDAYWLQAVPASATAGSTVTVSDKLPTNSRWQLAAVEITTP